MELQPPGAAAARPCWPRAASTWARTAAAGFAAEIGYYLAHHLEGADPQALDDLRDGCAEVMREAIGRAGLDHATALRAMLEALEFPPFPDAVPALRRVARRRARAGGGEQLGLLAARVARAAGLLELLDGVVSSAEVGVREARARPFPRGTRARGVGPEEALHVGDSLDNDVEGARAAGVRAVLVDRAGRRRRSRGGALALEVPSLL